MNFIPDFLLCVATKDRSSIPLRAIDRVVYGIKGWDHANPQINCI